MDKDAWQRPLFRWPRRNSAYLAGGEPSLSDNGIAPALPKATKWSHLLISPILQLVEAPLAGSYQKKSEEEQTECGFQLSTIEQWKETSWRTIHEVGDRHLTRDDECGRAGKQTDKHQETADDLDCACKTVERKSVEVRR